MKFSFRALRFRGKPGFTLISAVISGAVGIIVIFGLLKGLSATYRAERGIASNQDFTEIVHYFNLATSTAQACAQSGLIGIDLSPLLATPPVAVPIRLNHMGTTDAFIEAGKTPVSTRRIEVFSIKSLVAIGAPMYFATVDLTTSIVGKATTSRLPSKQLFILVRLDGANRITECRSSSAPTVFGSSGCDWYVTKDGVSVLYSSITPFQYCTWPSVSDHCFCPAGRAMTGFNYDQCPPAQRAPPLHPFFFASRCYCCPL
jgi:hypothetical protein